MRLVFMGTPGFAVPALRTLLSSRHTVSDVFTRPDRPSGRGRKVTFSEIKRLALERGLPIHQPSRLVPSEWKRLVEAAATDAVVVVAYGKILPPWLFDLPPHGAINLHASLLPRYRGAAPIPWAIAHGETRTGVTTMRIDCGLDTGDLLLQEAVDIGPEETAVELRDRLALKGAQLVVQTLDRLERKQIRATPQDPGEASYAPMLKKSDGQLDWSRSSQELFNRIRAFNPWPGSYTSRDGSMLRILRARPGDLAVPESPAGSLWRLGPSRAGVTCGKGALELLEVQWQNHKPIPARDFLNGLRLKSGQSIRLGP